MAKAKQAIVEKVIPFEGHQLVEMVVSEPEDFSYIPGKYMIVDTGIPLKPSKTVKRAYTIIRYQNNRVLLSAFPVAGGPGSNFLNQLKPEDIVSFSGPWGKFLPTPDHQTENTILVTDNGISAGLGLLQDRETANKNSKVYWLSHPSESYLSQELVCEMLPAPEKLVRIEIPMIAATNDRLAAIPQLMDHLDLDQGITYLAGDGILVSGIREQLVSLGQEPSKIITEYFFRKPAG